MSLEHERGILDGAQVATVADLGGGIPVVFRGAVADGATGNAAVIDVDYKVRVIDFWFVKTVAAGGAGDLISLKLSGGSNICDALDINVADKAVVRCAEIDDAQHEANAGSTLVVHRTKVSANNVAGIGYILAVRVA